MINECIWKSCLVDHSSLIVFSVCFRLVPTLIPTCSRSNLGSTQVQLWFNFGLDRTGNAVGAPVDCRWYGYRTAAEADQILKKLSSLVMGSNDRTFTAFHQMASKTVCRSIEIHGNIYFQRYFSPLSTHTSTSPEE